MSCNGIVLSFVTCSIYLFLLCFSQISRKQSWKEIDRPVVLYPRNIHSDYISNQVLNAQEQKQVMESEMKRVNEEIQEKLTIVNNRVNASVFILNSRVVNLEVNDLISVAAIFFPLLNKVSTSVDEHFENLRRVQSLDRLEVDSVPSEPYNIVGEILANVKDPDVEPELDSETESQTEIAASPPSREENADVDESKSSLPTPEETVNVFSLSDFKTSELDIRKELDASRNRDLLSWRDVCDDNEEVGQLPKSADSDEIVKEAIRGIDYTNLINDDYSTDDDYYMLPFTYSVTDNDLEKLKHISPDKSKSETGDALNVFNEAETYDLKDSIDRLPDYPVFPGGSLKLTLPVLRRMENHDQDNFPYTEFYQKKDLHDESKAQHVASHIQPERSLKMEILFNYTTRPFSEFILVDKEDVERALKFYFGVNASIEELEMNLR